jgi:glycosyltransferase involved in cell wall biosynthesis
MKHLLVIGHTFPEPDTTGAGIRMMQLINIFLREKYEITFATTAVLSERSADLSSYGITVKNITLNDSSFDAFAQQLNPDVVIFDRYITEEQFGWRISEQCPKALKILDTEDLHFLRKAREEAVRKGLPIDQSNIFSTLAKRELASILRCDLTLIISEYEMELLTTVFRISEDILYYLPFLIDSNPDNRLIPSFEDRKDFIAIGNLLHAPNVDSVLELKRLWPAIREHIPQAELHIYGSYAPQQISQLHNEKEGFLIKGWTEDVGDTMVKYRLQLAPIRFGAGLKGKLMDAMRYGLPSVTTQIGAEGLCGDFPFGGRISSPNQDFVEAAIEMYSDEKTWTEARLDGFNIIKTRFLKEIFSENFKNRIDDLLANLEPHRQHNFIGEILQHHNLQSTKYMSKWIEAKNSPQNASPVCFANSDEVRKEYL